MPSGADQHSALRILLSLAGLQVSGDCGPFTIYTNRRGKKVIYPRSPPTKPATPKQLRQRHRLRLAAANWKTQTDATKADWEAVTIRLSLPLTGYDLWISMSLVPRPETLSSAAARAGVTLTMPPWIQP